MKEANRCLLAGLVAVAFSTPTLAAVSAEEAKQLGGSVLTAWGAEKAGNKEGTIPAYTGEGVKAPVGYSSAKPLDRPDPFANEKPLFTITAQNATQYADKLDGLAEMFKKYPNYRMDIYPSHRTAFFPKWVLENAARNATSCKGENNDLKLVGCYGAIAFPIPKNGNQVMWNHLTTFVSQAWAGGSESYVVSNNGSVSMVGAQDGWEQSPYYDSTKKTAADPNSVYWMVRLDDTAPARKVGQKLVLIDALDNLNLGRRAFQYVPGQRRVKLAPDLNYDTPSPTGGGVMTMDDGKVFLGPLDRYDWKLVGKKEKFIPYNNFKLLAEHTTCKSDVVFTKSFVNPDCVRWELHRVWKVEAILKPGFRHIYAKRNFYWDEDGFGNGVAENFDASGKLYRLNVGTGFPYWASEDGGMMADLNVIYDLQTGHYLFNGFTGNPGFGWVPSKRKDSVFFSPEALAGEGIR